MKTLLVATFICFTHTVYAQGPCINDVKKLCPSIEKNKKNIVKCILDNEAKLSPACKERAKIIKAKSLEMKTNEKQGKGPKTQVGAKPKKAELGDNKPNQMASQKTMQINQANVQAVKVNCAESIKTQCANVKPGHGAILECLRTNMTKLTPKCKETISKI